MTIHSEVRTVQQLWQQYQRIRQRSLRICEPLLPEDYTVQPVADVSPPKWHLGHVSWFFENFILLPEVAGYELFDPQLNWFFNSYYESQGPRIQRTSRGNMTRPPLERVLAFRRHVDACIGDWLSSYGDEALPDELYQLFLIGLQHEQQHQELLVTDIKYILGTNPLYPTYRSLAENTPQSARPAQWIDVPEGLYPIGYAGQGFCWDNELSLHQHYLVDYAVQDRLVTNGEYLEFMKAGGYDHFAYWQMEGIEWARTLAVKAPLYWYEREGDWFEFTLNGLQPLDASLPVTHISYYEADAYARWRDCRLPTEQEWETACRLRHTDIPADGNFLETENYHPTRAATASDDQLLGQVWEWTNSAYLPYPNYPRFSGALGEYNGKFMINQMVLRGGSCATPHSHIRVSYRNFFHPDKRWQFTGIRLAR